MEKIIVEKHCELMTDTDKLENIYVHTGDEFEPEENLSDLSEEIYELSCQNQTSSQPKILKKKKKYNFKDHAQNQLSDYMRYKIEVKVGKVK